MSGSGTVVTGTLIDGTLSTGQEVQIVPRGLKSRIRGLQTHKSKVDMASPGSRVAANLVGITTSQLQRGDVITKPGWLNPTRMVTVKLNHISYLHRPLRHGATVSFHTGAAEVMAKVRLLEGDELSPGNSTWAQLSLVSPLAVIKGDRYIIRSPMETLGGGTVVDAQAKRLKRFRPEVIENLKAREEGSVDEIITALLETKQPMELSTLLTQSNLPAEQTRTAVESLISDNKIVSLGEGKNQILFTDNGWTRVGEKAVTLLADYHRKFPARAGMPKIELSGKLKLGNHSPAAFTKFIDQGSFIEEGGYLRLPSHSIRLTPAQQAGIEAFLKVLSDNPYAPPGENIPEPDLLTMLIEQGKVVKVSDTIVFPSVAYNDMVARITEEIKTNGKIGLGEVRDMFGTSRKYAQALLEYLDREKVTRRVGDDRVLY